MLPSVSLRTAIATRSTPSWRWLAEYHLLPEDLTLLWGAKPIQDPKTRKLTNIYELYAIRTNRRR